MRELLNLHGFRMLRIILINIAIATTCVNCHIPVNFVDHTPCNETPTLTKGNYESCAIQPGEEHTYLFYGKSQEKVTISASSRDESLDLKLRLSKYVSHTWNEISPGKVLGSDDNSGPDLDPLIEGVLLPEEVLYKITVSAWGASVPGRGSTYVVLVDSVGSIFQSRFVNFLIGFGVATTSFPFRISMYF